MISALLLVALTLIFVLSSWCCSTDGLCPLLSGVFASLSAILACAAFAIWSDWAYIKQLTSTGGVIPMYSISDPNVLVPSQRLVMVNGASFALVVTASSFMAIVAITSFTLICCDPSDLGKSNVAGLDPLTKSTAPEIFHPLTDAEIQIRNGEEMQNAALEIKRTDPKAPPPSMATAVVVS